MSKHFYQTHPVTQSQALPEAQPTLNGDAGPLLFLVPKPVCETESTAQTAAQPVKRMGARVALVESARYMAMAVEAERQDVYDALETGREVADLSFYIDRMEEQVREFRQMQEAGKKQVMQKKILLRHLRHENRSKDLGL